MPARNKTTAAGNAYTTYVMGVDGCRAGWAVVQINLCDNSVSGFIVERFDAVLKLNAAMTIVDMPIGLADAGRRHCETLARQKLTPGRMSSVFSSPRRPMLNFETYAEANAWGKAQQQKGGLSKQAWMIAPKIREIDAAITPDDQARLGEGHPEVAFARLKGGPCTHPKRKKEGERERLTLLERAGINNAEDIYQALRAGHGAKAIARDDVYDACVLALTAKARLANTAWRLSDDARDARGLVMEIWG
ncbi:DUF429 domain-containing protein [Hyphococcus sp.]|uniref:DUF429 domain-containing protein n=1 Tax=Hyphococcus sp. TaxID=2038636 RepID=UPI003753DF57